MWVPGHVYDGGGVRRFGGFGLVTCPYANRVLSELSWRAGQPNDTTMCDVCSRGGDFGTESCSRSDMYNYNVTKLD